MNVADDTLSDERSEDFPGLLAESEPVLQPSGRGHLWCSVGCVVATASSLVKIEWGWDFMEDPGLDLVVSWWTALALACTVMLFAPLVARAYRGISQSQAAELCRAGALGYSGLWLISGWPSGDSHSFFRTIAVIAAYWAARWAPGRNRQPLFPNF